MNRIFRIVFNTSTGRYVVASEMAKGHKKASGKAGGVVAAMTFTVSSALMVPTAMAGTPNSFSVGVVSNGNTSCVSSAATGVLNNAAICDSGGGGTSAGMVSYNSSGGWGAYITTTDANTLRLGAAGVDKFRVLSTGLFAYDTLSMGSNKITALANGSVASGSAEAINGGQLWTSNTAMAAVFGGGAAATSTGITAPSYALTNANTINSGSGSASSVGAGFTKVDDALGKLDTRTTANTTNIATLTTRVNQGINISADGGATSQNIGLGGTIKYAAGINSTVSRSGDTITYDVVDNPTFAGMVTANGGLTVGAGKTVNMGGNRVSGVAAGVAATDAVNKNQLDTSVAAAAKWQLQANGATADTITASDTVNVVNGSNTTASYDATTNQLKVDVVSNPTFAGMVTANGGLTVGAGKTIDMGANKVTNVADGAVASGGKDAINGGQLYLTEQKMQQQGTTTATMLGGVATYNATTGALSAPSYALGKANGINSTSGAATNVGAAFSKVDDALGAVDTRTTTNATNITNLTTRVNQGINISADNGTSSQNIVPGGTIKYAAGTNATVSRSGDTITYDVVDNPSFTGMVTAGGGLTVGAGKTVNMGSNRVSGVANGVAATDAVNKGQLDTSIAAAGKWQLQANGGTADTITAADTVNVVNGSNTTASYDAATNQLKVDVVDNPTFSGMVTANGGLTVGAGKTIDMGANKVSNVADGNVASGSKEAVNGGQLFVAEQRVQQQGMTTATMLGGGAAYNAATGAVSAPSYALAKANGINGTTGAAGDVGSALDKVDTALGGLDDDITSLDSRVTTNEGDIANLDNRVTNVEGDITNISSGKTGLVQQSAAGAKLTVGKDTDGTEVDFADKNGAARKLTNVADGNVASGSKEAVNGGQLYLTEQRVQQQGTTTATMLGGGAAYNAATGAVSAPSYALAKANGINGTTGAAGDVGSALDKVDTALGGLDDDITSLDSRVTTNEGDIANLDNRVTNVEGDITNITSGKTGLVQQSAAGAKLTVGKDTDGTEVDFADKNGAARKLTNVADGAVASGSKEAVNGGQLYLTEQRVQQQGMTTATMLGGGAAYNAATGAVSAPSYALAKANGINGTTGAAADVGSALDKVDTALGGLDDDITALDSRVTTNEGDIANLDNRVTNVEGDITNITSGKTGLVQQSAAGAKLTVGKDTDGTEVDFGDKTGVARKLTNVADGAVASGSKEAVNGGQLYLAEQRVQQQGMTMANLLGGGAAYNAVTGVVSAPSYTLTRANGINGTTGAAANVGDAMDKVDAALGTLDDDITDLDGRVTNVEGDIANINSGKTGLVQQSAAGAKLTVGKDTDGTEVDFADKTGAARKLTNVADGNVASGSKEAVNGGQLYGVSKSVAGALGGGSTVNADGTISTPSYKVTNADGSTSTVSGVEGAVTNLDGRVHSNTTAINTLTSQINNGSVGLVKQDEQTRDITVAKDKDGTRMNIAGTAGDRTLSGVAAGKADNDAVNVGQLKAAGLVDANGQARAVVAYDSADKTSVTMGGEGSKPVAVRNVAEGKADNDAVNVAQMTRANKEAVAQANTYTDSRIDDVWNNMGQINYQLAKQDRRISDVGAMAMATAQMTSNATAASIGSPNGAWAVGIGVQNGRSALSAGYAKPIGEKSRISFGAAFSGQDSSIGIGFGRSL